ncbi:hypothetical protein ACFY8W_11610 [Streptomyces sp. NPDC012637]|uniref:hypothetical protein n=1 Tax=Streptomyces sp. NPDC012637 TaxID=3364842 RepID=UPI0036E549FA
MATATGADTVTAGRESAEPGGGPHLREFGTGLLRTRVTGGAAGTGAGRYVWERRPGALAPAPFAAPLTDAAPVTDSAPLTDAAPATDAVRRLLDGGDASVRWAPGTPTADGEGRIYRVRGPESAAGRLLYHGPDDELADALRGLGAALRTLHDTPLPTGAVTPGPLPRGLVRFTDWLAGRSPQPRAAYAETLLRPRLGESRMARLHGLCERIAADADRVPCHGAAALGSLVPAEGAPGEADMLVGEDLCLAPWYWDLGWTLGELVELKWYRGDSGPAWPKLLDALFEGYGRSLGDDWSSLAALRVLLHLHDYTAYVGWDERNFEKYTGFATFLLDLGLPAADR